MLKAVVALMPLLLCLGDMCEWCPPAPFYWIASGFDVVLYRQAPLQRNAFVMHTTLLQKSCTVCLAKENLERVNWRDTSPIFFNTVDPMPQQSILWHWGSSHGLQQNLRVKQGTASRMSNACVEILIIAAFSCFSTLMAMLSVRNRSPHQWGHSSSVAA